MPLKDIRSGLDGLPDGAGLNMAYEAVDRHAGGTDSERVALRWIDNRGQRHDYTYQHLATLTNRFANLLRQLGVGEGESVFTVLGRIPELYITALGTLKAGSVFCPLYASFGPELLRTRLALGACKLLVTTEGLYRRKLASLRDELPELQHVLLAADSDAPTGTPATGDFRELLGKADEHYHIPTTPPETPALLHYTSGTTGTPKGAVHVHESAVNYSRSARAALDLRPGDIFWCTADPGWITGTIYGILAPLTLGTTVLVDQRDFDVQSWYRTLQDEHVDVWYTSPTAVRMMMRAGTELSKAYDFSRLRFMATVGEPLNPTAVLWGQEAFGRPFHDTWWQTETGAIMIANDVDTPIRPGSMGRPLQGIQAAIVQRSGKGLKFTEQPNEVGELALLSPWPSMFRDYLGASARYRECFVDGWYLSGDLARRDADGYFWFIGRKDDAIKSSGHLIAPFEVESVLMEHSAVVEAAAIGKPSAVATETVKAFVILRAGYESNEPLRRELLAHARRRLGPAVAPREIDFRQQLPKTRSGKIMRRLLKAEEQGHAPGDVSGLANGKA